MSANRGKASGDVDVRGKAAGDEVREWEKGEGSRGDPCCARCSVAGEGTRARNAGEDPKRWPGTGDAPRDASCATGDGYRALTADDACGGWSWGFGWGWGHGPGDTSRGVHDNVPDWFREGDGDNALPSARGWNSTRPRGRAGECPGCVVERDWEGDACRQALAGVAGAMRTDPATLGGATVASVPYVVLSCPDGCEVERQAFARQPPKSCDGACVRESGD
mmetsp:Transcript_34787/g.95949  ORF Transcript_34787/g.95949 Transcript_34787/m.95949 type:complete len:221 (-) Transcript_34787:458-1120(-)